MQAKSSSANTKTLANDYAPCSFGAHSLLAHSQPNQLRARASAENALLETQSQRTSLHFRPKALQFARGRVGVNRRIGLIGRIACFSRRVSQSHFSAPIYRSILGYPPLINQQRKTEDMRYPQLIYLMQTCPRVTPVRLKVKYPIIIMKPTFYEHRSRLWNDLANISGQCLCIYYHHCILTNETTAEGSFSTKSSLIC